MQRPSITPCSSIMDSRSRVLNYEFRYMRHDDQAHHPRIHAIALSRPSVHHHLMLTPFLTGRLVVPQKRSTPPKKQSTTRRVSINDNGSDDDSDIPATKLYSWIGRPFGSGPARLGGSNDVHTHTRGPSRKHDEPRRATPSFPSLRGGGGTASNKSKRTLAQDDDDAYGDDREQTVTASNVDYDEYASDKQLLMTFACPSRARNEAETQRHKLAVTLSPKAGTASYPPQVEAVSLSTQDALDLGRSMKMPVLVVLASRCSVESREVIHDVALLRRTREVA